jgi:hypothetical protein
VVVLSLTVVAAIALLWSLDPSQWRLPLCSFYASTGLYCPGCGGTRATHELLHGHLRQAMRYNGLWVVLLPVLVYALLSEVSLSFRGRPLPGDLSRRAWFLIGLAAIALVFGVLRNLPWYPCTLLAPPA